MEENEPAKQVSRCSDIKKTTNFASSKATFIVSVMLLPSLVSAGIFSSFLFNKSSDTEEIVEESVNSQNIDLLQAVLNTSPEGAIGGGDITIVDNKALLAETGLSGSLVEVNEKSKTGHISIYEVRNGDTLSQIAEMFGVSVNTIRWANNLEGAISPGQTLVILPITGVKHVVKNGGTVEDVAEIYEGDPREIALFNGISIDTELQPGDEILVPNGEMHTEEPVKTTVVSSGSSSSGSSASGPSYSGYFMRPISGGYRSQGIHGYNAVDLAAPAGTPIYASAGGVVIISRSSGWNGGYGNYVVIKHDNGTQTLYAHMNAVNVVVGQRVSQGSTIGSVGNTGRSTGAHVHFEIRGAKNPF